MTLSSNSLRAPSTAAASPDSYSYIVYYTGDIKNLISKIPEASVVILNPYMAVIFITPAFTSSLMSIKEISIIESVNPYILTSISPLDSSNIVKFTSGELIPLSGTGVIVGLIDTGIDYLNREFTREDDTSRIISIWDQTDNSGIPPSFMGYGSEYTNNQINQALKTKADGKDPYSIVPERDTNGHGTQCAGIIGARGFGEVKGAAPNCNFLVVKLRPTNIEQFIAHTPPELVTQYNNTDIATAMAYLIEERKKLKQPMVVFLPVSSNFGEHNGSRPIEELITYYSYSYPLAFALGSGNQGNSQTHASGILKNSDDIATIEFQTSKDQFTLNLSIWIPPPDKASISIISPSGQVTPKISVKIGVLNDLRFLYENTSASVSYSLPDPSAGYELINTTFSNLAPGIWKILLYGDYIVNGRYDAWISQRPISRPGTALLNPDNNVTLTIPSTSNLGLTTAYYDQNNNTIGELSGVGFTSDNKVRPDITSGGVNVLTTSLNNTTTTITGSSAATAVLAGAMTLLFQWGIVDGNVPNMSSAILKSFLITGAKKRPNDIYPNPYWGYGILDLSGTFDAIRGIYTPQTSSQLGRDSNYSNDNITTNIPREIFKRLF
ncbi:MAG: S8 family peptidase [Clostridium sp.]|uniref:S8 family peptidase n=1 Tax=Clostridium sp. TaxID=1506 RepID=UPI003066A45B